MKSNSSNWNSDKSIAFSRILVAVFACAIAALDAVTLLLCSQKVYDSFRFLSLILPAGKLRLLTICILLCNVPGFALLLAMNRLLKNLRAGSVFTPENVALLRRVSWCCFGAALFCLIFAFPIPSLLAVTLAAGFVGLIVRIVKNVFEQAILMKDELDLTV